MNVTSPEGRTLRLARLYGLTFVVAGCSIVYELLIAQTLAHLAASTVTWYSLTIGCYLLAMGAGAGLCGWRFNRGSPWNALFRVEILLSLSGALAVPLVHSAHAITGIAQLHHTPSTYLWFFAPSLLWAFWIGLLSGFELPLLLRAAEGETEGQSRIHQVLAADYFGSLAGAVLFPLVLVPFLSLFAIGVLVAALNLAVAYSLLATRRVPVRRVFFTSQLGAMGVAGMMAMALFLDRIEQFFLRKFYYLPEGVGWAEFWRTDPTKPDIERVRSHYQNIDFVTGAMSDPSDLLRPGYSKRWDRNTTVPSDVTLFLNGDFQLNSGDEEIYHEYFAHVPIAAVPDVPQKVLVLGAGDTCLIRELLKYREIATITHVELDPTMDSLARTHSLLTALNRKAAKSPRVKLVLGDAYHFVRHCQERFDAVFIDFPAPVDYNLARLYSREFYSFVRGCLAPHGFVVLDSPDLAHFSYPDAEGNQSLLPENSWFSDHATLRAAGFRSIRPFVTQLDLDDARVHKLLDTLEFAIPHEEGQDRALVEQRARRLLLLRHRYRYQQGFLVCTAEPNRFRRVKFRPRHNAFDVLNERRFHLAWNLDYPPGDAVTVAPNSIFRPTLPGLPLWFTRTPY